jgi:hypothetical protein
MTNIAASCPEPNWYRPIGQLHALLSKHSLDRAIPMILSASNANTYTYKKKDSSVHVAPTCAGSRDGSDHFGPFSAILQEVVSRTWTHDLMVTRQQRYRCAKAPLLKGSPVHVIPACAGSREGSNHFITNFNSVKQIECTNI